MSNVRTTLLKLTKPVANAHVRHIQLQITIITRPLRTRKVVIISDKSSLYLSPGTKKDIFSEMEEKQQQLKLYSYYRSSCSWRVRIALNLKALQYQYKAVNLLKGDQFTPEFSKLNPINYVPVLVDGDVVIADSFAILLYLEDKFPHHPLLPQDLQKKAINYQAANIVASNIQPLQNLAILKYIEEKISPDERLPWAKYHIEKGFTALENLLNGYAGRYATGDEVFLADLFLAPQIDAAITRFNVDMAQFPILSRLNAAYNELPAFQNARPEKQLDAPVQSKG